MSIIKQFEAFENRHYGRQRKANQLEIEQWRCKQFRIEFFSPELWMTNPRLWGKIDDIHDRISLRGQGGWRV